MSLMVNIDVATALLLTSNLHCC